MVGKPSVLTFCLHELPHSFRRCSALSNAEDCLLYVRSDVGPLFTACLGYATNVVPLFSPRKELYNQSTDFPRSATTQHSVSSIAIHHCQRSPETRFCTTHRTALKALILTALYARQGLTLCDDMDIALTSIDGRYDAFQTLGGVHRGLAFVRSLEDNTGNRSPLWIAFCLCLLYLA